MSPGEWINRCATTMMRNGIPLAEAFFHSKKAADTQERNAQGGKPPPYGKNVTQADYWADPGKVAVAYINVHLRK